MIEIVGGVMLLLIAVMIVLATAKAHAEINERTEWRDARWRIEVAICWLAGSVLLLLLLLVGWSVHSLVN